MYFAGDFAAGEWKNQDAEEWKNGCVADLRQRPPQATIKSSNTPSCSAMGTNIPMVIKVICASG